jgi:hypothetical protein
MLVQDFATPADLQKFCVDNSIVQTKILQVWCKDNRWWLFYYA